MQFPNDGSTIVNIANAKNVFVHYDGFNVNDQKPDSIFKKLGNRLKHRYKRIRLPSHLWNQDLPLEKCFISLRIDEDHWVGKIPVGKTIQLKDIFCCKEESGDYTKQRILIRGNPGYGKSTLIRKLAFDWASLKTPSYLSVLFDIVIIVQLKKLENMTVEEAIVNEFDGKDAETLLNKLHDTNLKFLLLLDGFDETAKTDKITKFLSLESEKEFFCNLTVIVTSRPQAADAIWEKFDHHLSILGFSEDNQIKYINELVGHKKNIKEELLEKLKSNSFLSDLSKCPLMLHMLCCLQSERNTRISNVNTLTGLYTGLLQLLTACYNRKHNNEEAPNEGDLFIKQDLILRLGKLAYCLFKKPADNNLPITSLSKQMLDSEFPKEEDFKFVTDLGILIPASFAEDENAYLCYDFSHQTIAIFLTVFYIVKLPKYEQMFVFCDMFYPNNDLFIICFFFGLMKDEILKSRIILQHFSDRFWEADWVDKLKDEISQETWDKLALQQQFIKKLSCCTHNFSRNASWYPLRGCLEEIKVTINLMTDCWDKLRTELVSIIKSCESLMALTISVLPFPETQVAAFEDNGIALVNFRFLMDDIIELSLLDSLKKFHVNIRIASLDITSTPLSTQSCFECHTGTEHKMFGLCSSHLMKTNNINFVQWNVGKIEIMLSFRQLHGGMNSAVKFAILLISEEQCSKVIEQPFCYRQDNVWSR